MTQPSVNPLNLPPLPDFSHAILEGVTVGPRRAVTLTLSPLVWAGTQGKYSPPVTVRLGGIVGFDEAAAFFAEQRLPTDIAGLNYAAGHVSKPNALFLEIAFERVEARLIIQCQRVTISKEAVSPWQAGV